MYHKILDEAIQELKEDEFTELFADEKDRKYVNFTQIDTDLENLIPDEYVTNISERYNLYAEIGKLDNEEQLQQFEKSLADRFGPIPKPVFELFNTLRLQWYGKKIGFEKISYKKNTLKAYFIGNAKSSYFDSEAFGKVLAFVQRNPTICNLKEVKGQLRIAFHDISTIQAALDILKDIL